MTTAAPSRQLKVEDALAYLDQVKAEYEMQPHVYNEFLDIMKEFKAQSIDTPGVIDRVLNLFDGKRQLILGFNTFLPPGYKIEFTTDENQPPRVQLKYPPGMTGPQPQLAAAASADAAPPGAKFQVGAMVILINGNLRYEAEIVKVTLNEQTKPAPTGPTSSYLVRYTKWPRRPEEWVNEAFVYPWDEAAAKAVTNRPPRNQMWVEQKPPPTLAPPPAALVAPAQPPAAPFAPTQPPARSQKKAPIEFDQAINYITKIKQRFSQEPGTYRAFLEILHVYQKEQKSIKSVYEEVYRLFKGHPDLIAEFAVFLPDGTVPRTPPMVRWRRAVRLIGKLQMLHRRAAERAYAPGGGGFLAARDEFEELAGSPTSAEPAVDLDAELPDEELPEAAEAAEAGEASAAVGGEGMASEDSDSGASIASTIKGLPRRKLQDILLSLAEDPAEQERIVRALQAAAERPATKGRGGGKQKGKRRFHRAAVGGGASDPPVAPQLSPTLAPASPPLMILRTPSVEAY